MFANKTLIQSVATHCRSCCPKSSISPLSFSQKCNRELHTSRIKTTLQSFGRSPLLLQVQTEGNLRKRIAGYLVICRSESTITKIPPLSSEVFSRQVLPAEETSSLATPVEAVSAVSTNTLQENTQNTTSTLLTSSTNVESSAVPTAASTESIPQSLVWENIPEPPVIPSQVSELVANGISAGGEVSFTSLGLGGWSPSGIVQQCLEFAHIGMGLPWWGSILLGTVCVRLLVFPLVIKSQRNAAKMNNNMPQIQAIQLKMTEARQTGNAMMAAKYGQDMIMFMKEKDISPFKSILVPLAMAPIFISFFFGLRTMANLPVDSLREGGLWWFTDLTVADPYCLLPLITSVTLWITMEVGVDGVQLSASNHGQVLRYFMRSIPVIMFPFIMNFPAAILCYWVSTNAISLVQVSLMKIPAIRSYLNIETLKRFKPDSLPIQKKGFVASVKDSWTNVKISKEMEDRTRYDEISFKRAGRGPIPKTYKYDPTRVIAEKDSMQGIEAKAKQNR